MEKRRLEDLNLLDDFLFGSMLTYPEIGEKFIREILKVIFHRDFGKLRIVPQKVYYGCDTDKHGARLDVYLEEELLKEDMVVYDIEPDRNETDMGALPRRVRFYHAKIDAQSLKAGDKYQTLKRVIIIMIMSYDPFGRNRMIYTVKNACVEEPDMPYDDGARTLFLYTKGTEGNPPEELRQLLCYMENTTEENVKNDNLKALHQMVTTVKRDGEVSLSYMKIFEREEMLLAQGRREGIEQERENTRREQENARRERDRADEAEKEIARLKAEIREMKNGK